MKNKTKQIITQFEKNVSFIEELINFDRVVLQFSIDQIEELKEKLKKHHGIDNPRLTAENTLKSLKTIRNNDSLRDKYETIFNQALVLLISYFTSSVRDLFKLGLAIRLNSAEESLPFLKDDVKIPLEDLRNLDVEDNSQLIIDLLFKKQNFSFQDAQSIKRIFKHNLNIEIKKDKNTNNIILGQACRHAIVHSSSTVDRKLINQIKEAIPRDIKNSLKSDQNIKFTPEEITTISESMKKYIKFISVEVNKLIKEL